jgi:hypothetical protein
MTEQVNQEMIKEALQQAAQQQAQPQQQPQQLLTYAHVKQIRHTALQMLHQRYMAFMQSIGWMSGDEKSLNEGMELIDAGFLSLQKAILLAPVAALPRIPVTPIPQPEAPTQQEKAQEVDKAPEEVKTEEVIQPELPPAA